jgi:hypothetical protein
MKQITIFTFIIVFFLVLGGNAQATEIGLATTKNLFDLSILAGDSYKDNLVVFNTSESVALPVHIQLSLWDLKEDSDDIEFVMAEPALNAVKWFQIEENMDFILEPDGKKQINFQIEPPPEAVPGSYFVMMRFQAVVPEYYFTEQGPRMLPELGVLFFIKIPILSLDGDRELYQVNIQLFELKDADSIGLLEKILPFAEAGVFENIVKELTAKVSNAGIYHFKANGFVDIQNMFGKSIARADLPERFLLPNRVRNINVKVFQDESFFERNFRFGPHTAIMVLNVPGSDQPIVEQIRFWAFPWKTIIAVLWIGALFIILRRRIWAAGKALFGLKQQARN